MFFIWQTSAYGSGRIDLEAPADIYRSRPMPCTPAGDLIASFKTAAEAESILPQLAMMTTEQAIAFCKSKNGEFTI